jgi:hypothetical protein
VTLSRGADASFRREPPILKLKVGESQHVLGVATLRLQSARIHQNDAGYVLKPEQNDTAMRWLGP